MSPKSDPHSTPNFGLRVFVTVLTEIKVQEFRKNCDRKLSATPRLWSEELRHVRAFIVEELRQGEARMQTFKHIPAGQIGQLLAAQGIAPDCLVTVTVEDVDSPRDRPKLSELIANSPLAELEFESESVRSPVREVEL